MYSQPILIVKEVLHVEQCNLSLVFGVSPKDISGGHFWHLMIQGYSVVWYSLSF